MTKTIESEETGQAVLLAEGGEGGHQAAVDPSLRPVTSLVVAMLMGLVFGVCFEKSNVYLPANIQGQFVFSRWIMLKMFMAAVGSGAMVLSALSVLNPAACTLARDEFYCCCNRGVWTAGLTGGYILGVGMAVGGACPGMVLSQIGTGVPGCGWTVAGGLSGSVLYGVLEPTLRPFIYERGLISTASLDKVFPRAGYTALSLALGLGCVAVSLCLEVAVDWRTEADVATCSNALNCPWPPSSAGALIGLLQAPAVLVLGDTLGSSTAYMTAVSWLFAGEGARVRFPYFSKFTGRTVANTWQVLYVLLVVAGSYLSASATNGGGYGLGQGVSTASAVSGGLLMIFGARMAGGCTSGHGLSGMAVLSMLSFAVVPAMFGGGITAAFIMQASGSLLG
jgi:hypothetical protein